MEFTELIFLVLALIAAMTALLAAQVALVAGYAWRLRSAGYPSTQDADDQQPPAAIIMCVRGNDPSLNQAVEAALSQDYPHFQAWFVFDNEDDPGYEVVSAISKQNPRAPIRMAVIDQLPDEGSLKCHAVVHAIGKLGPEIEVVALVDADTIVHPSWLKELVAPFADERVGAATGIRWYEPASNEMGTLVRCIWNTAAIVQMYWYRIPWGGSLAIRRCCFDNGRLIERWKTSFCEDTLVEQELTNQGLELRTVPELIMVNRERTSLLDCQGWIFRQLLTTRLYHRAWNLVASHGLGTSIGLLLGTLFFVIAVPMGDLFVVGLLACFLVFYQVVSLGMLAVINWTSRSILKRAGRPLDSWGGELVILYAMALPLTQIVYASATVRALIARQVVWRGVMYNIGKSGSVRMQHYRPFAEVSRDTSAEHSVS